MLLLLVVKCWVQTYRRDVLSRARCPGRHPTCMQWRAHSTSLSASPLQIPHPQSEQTNLLLNTPAISPFFLVCSSLFLTAPPIILTSGFASLQATFCSLIFLKSSCSPLLSSLYVCLSLFLYPLDLQLSVKFHHGGCCAWINQSWLAFSLSAPRWLIFLVRYNLMLYPISSRAN